jgi:hypothetical protein
VPVSLSCSPRVVVSAAHAVSLDGVSGTLWSLAFEDTTEYAPQYSALGFWRVRKAMTERQVAALAGQPLERYAVASPALYGWRWSRSSKDGSYFVRVILFRNGRVVEKYSEFYVD